MSKISWARLFNFLLVIESYDFKVCQKKLPSSDFNELGMMLEVDETFTMI